MGNLTSAEHQAMLDWWDNKTAKMQEHIDDQAARIRDLEAQLEAADRLAEAADGSFGQDGGTNRLAKALAAYRAQREGSDGG